MKLQKSQAEQIVKEISKVIEQPINMMDENGKIIASTDQTRIDTLHGGAAQILKNKLSELVIETEDEFVGARNGVNLPIIFDGEIVGVVGVTGKIDEVKKYGQIIKKMTEILLLENYVKDQKLIEQKIRERFLEEMIFGQNELGNLQEFIRRGESLGINVLAKYRVVVFGVVNSAQYSPQILTEISREMRKIVAELANCHFTRTSARYVLIIEPTSENSLLCLVKRIKAFVEATFNVKLAVGIDSAEGKLKVNDSYVMAEKACRSSENSTSSDIKFYDEIDFELFMSEIKPSIKLEYVNKIFRGENKQEIANWVELLTVFYEHNGSLAEASDKLFIHKNTLQYKLNKLKQISGYDPRNYKHAAIFVIAIKFFNSVSSLDI